MINMSQHRIFKNDNSVEGKVNTLTKLYYKGELPFKFTVLFSALLSCGVINNAMASDECGAASNGSVTCSGSSYTSGIHYNSTTSGDLALVIDNADMTVTSSTKGNSIENSGLQMGHYLLILRI